MARKIKDVTLCELGGCNHKATVIAHKLWGKGGTIRTCDKHRPGSAITPETPAHLRPIRPFYRIEEINS